MFKNAKIKKMFDDDEPKIVFYLDSKGIDFKDVFKDDEDLIEKSIKEHKNTIAEAAITYCTNINRLNKNGQSYLMISIMNDNFDMFKKLLDTDIKLDIIDNNRESSLFYAIKNGNRDYFDYLIEKKVDIKGFNIKGENTAICAYLNNRKDIVYYLLDNKVFINHIDKDGNTILHHALSNGDDEFAINLIEYGADVFIRNYNHKNCLDIAKDKEIDSIVINKVCELISNLFIEEENEKLLELLVEYEDVENYEDFNVPFLIAVFSVKYNNKVVFDKILRNTKLLNSLDYRGKSLLMYCVEFGKFVMARKIIYLDGDLNLTDKDNKTILFTVLEQLINTKNNDTVKEDFKIIFNELLDRHVDVNCQDSNGNTVLMNAIINKQQTVIDKLIEYPYIDLNIMNNDGKTALIMAYESEDLKTVHKIVSSRKAEINAKDNDNNTLLLLTLLNDNLELFNALLYNGADLDIKYDEGMTILMISLNLQKNRFIVKIFEHPTFEVDIQDENGLSALMHAIRNRNSKVVEALLRCGADINVKDKNGDSAIFYALEIEDFEIARLLRTFENNN